MGRARSADAEHVGWAPAHRRNPLANAVPTNGKREASVWQNRYWQHSIRDHRDDAVHMDYIHFSPVKHGLAARPADWPFSSFAKCVTLGLHQVDWPIEGAGLADTGERL